MGTQRYNALYVFKNSYESGGRFWGAVFHQLMVGLYGMQVALSKCVFSLDCVRGSHLDNRLITDDNYH